ncbi:hypothetical protein B5C34_05210 [Pacificimonas flava]|uniref:Uncharacterized protein n=2 Tax=Pacificimonas TaxID=1960290 RepID=A0A219B3I6_9SPHN|nr:MULTISPECIES: hypothetical protein [Pacificimonas]MBZ6377383.1 hypothetical protein [Pacificimonas aurantium]OWV32910.1 hypothetical protein B5C34_05210 [Pacificimonas flava]
MRDLSYMLAIPEVTYGTAPVMAAASDTMEIFDYRPEPAIYDEQPRRAARIFPGARAAVMTRGRQRHVFKYDLRGSGTATVPPRWTRFLRASMFGEAVPAADKVDYPLLSSEDGGSLALIGQKDKLRMTPAGVRGNNRFVFEEGQTPYGEADFLGLLPALPTSQAPGAPVYPSEPASEPVSTENTSFAINGFALLLRSFTLDLGMKTSFRSLVGGKRVIFDSNQSGDRRELGGRIVAELPDPAVKSFFQQIDQQTPVSLSFLHGSEEGRRIGIASGQMHLKPISLSDEQGQLMMTADYKLVPIATNIDVVLTTS